MSLTHSQHSLRNTGSAVLQRQGQEQWLKHEPAGLLQALRVLVQRCCKMPAKSQALGRLGISTPLQFFQRKLQEVLLQRAASHTCVPHWLVSMKTVIPNVCTTDHYTKSRYERQLCRHYDVL